MPRELEFDAPSRSARGLIPGAGGAAWRLHGGTENACAGTSNNNNNIITSSATWDCLFVQEPYPKGGRGGLPGLARS